MAHPMAYGDSQEYYRLARQQAQQKLAMQHANAVQQYNAYSSNQAVNWAHVNAYQNMAGHMRNVAPAKPASSPDRVISDRGFGGAESRPRMARYRKKALASIPVK